MKDRISRKTDYTENGPESYFSILFGWWKDIVRLSLFVLVSANIILSILLFSEIVVEMLKEHAKKKN